MWKKTRKNAGRAEERVGRGMVGEQEDKGGGEKRLTNIYMGHVVT
jgi:hypothetical protein